jgi:hypothetical protein
VSEIETLRDYAQRVIDAHKDADSLFSSRRADARNDFVRACSASKVVEIIDELTSASARIEVLERERDEARAMVGAELPGLENEKRDAIRRWQKAHADCQEMIRLHDEVEKERDAMRRLGEIEKLARDCVHRGGAEYSELEMSQLATALLDLLPVVRTAIEWSESFGELSKRLPPHVHKLRRAVDEYERLALERKV